MDGSENTVVFTNGDTHAVNTSSTDYTLAIGASSGGTSRPFNGRIDDVWFYARVLSDTEILALYETKYIADMDEDDTIGLGDLAGLVVNWQMIDCGDCSGADFTGDNIVGIDDLAPHIEF